MPSLLLSRNRQIPRVSELPSFTTAKRSLSTERSPWARPISGSMMSTLELAASPASWQGVTANTRPYWALTIRRPRASGVIATIEPRALGATYTSSQMKPAGTVIERSMSPATTAPPNACAIASPHGVSPSFAMTTAGTAAALAALLDFHDPSVPMRVRTPAPSLHSIIAHAPAGPPSLRPSMLSVCLPAASVGRSMSAGRAQSSVVATSRPSSSTRPKLSTLATIFTDRTSASSVNSRISVTCSVFVASLRDQIQNGAARAAAAGFCVALGRATSVRGASTADFAAV